VALGCERALVVCSDDGVDELSSADRTRVVEVAEGGTEEWFTSPEELGFPRVELSDIAGGSPVENAAVVRGVLAGQSGPARDVVLMNAGAAILAAGAGADLGAAVDRAREAVDSGAAERVLQRLVALTGELSPSG
jgi:anthranilate phosphoribosyltransferase